MRKQWVCTECDSLTFTLVLLNALPFQVVVFCAQCGHETAELGLFKPPEPQVEEPSA